MNNITEVTAYFVTLMAIAAAVVTVLMGGLVAKLVSRHLLTRSVAVDNRPATRQRIDRSGALSAARGRRTAHQH